MMQFETITEGGVTYAKVPLHDMQDMADIVEGERVLAAIESGEEEDYPFELISRIIDGENPVKVFRIWRGMTQQQLADTAGLKQPAIVRAEKGAAISVASLSSVARALRVDIGLLVTG